MPSTLLPQGFAEGFPLPGMLFPPLILGACFLPSLPQKAFLHHPPLHLSSFPDSAEVVFIKLLTSWWHILFLFIVCFDSATKT